LGEEKRRFDRIDFRSPLKYQLKDAQDLVGSLTCDLSEGGTKFNAEEFIPLSSELTVELDLEPNKPVAFHGRVSWVQLLPHSDRYQVGMEFEDSELYSDSRKEVRQYIESHQ